MHSLLVIKHVENEGPGTIGDYFKDEAWAVKSIDLSRGKSLPASPDQYDAIVCMGGPMNVYEEDRYPFLRVEDEFIRKTVAEGVPFLGICLGSQLLAKACGAKVKKAPVKEMGWSKVGITEAGRRDPLFNGVKDEALVFQWHEDTFDIPEKGVLLAESAVCANQAFRVGRNAYGLQFHIEVTPEIITEWLKSYDGVGQESAEMIKEARLNKMPFLKQAYHIHRNFLTITGSPPKVSF